MAVPGVLMAIHFYRVRRDGTELPALVKRLASSAPRAVQRPCSTQKDEIGILPDFPGTRILTPITRSCLPPLTISPAWMNTSSSPRFSSASAAGSGAR